MGNIIRIDGLTKTYGHHTVLNGIDLTVDEGATVALLGPNGAGKTTLVRILSTLIQPDAGTATIAGHDVVRDARAVRSLISLTGQYAAVDELLTGRENLRLLGRLLRLPQREAEADGRELLDRFDLLDAASRPVKSYSGGMRRKLDLALSLLARPRVLFLDEPTTGLDPRSRIAMWEVVRDLANAGTTVFLTTQYLEEADQLADELMLIDHGRVIAQGTPERLKQDLNGDTLELHFESEATCQKAVRLLGPRAIADALTPRTLTVATRPGTEDVRLLLNDLAGAGITVERVRLIEPSLDDVFLALTGRPAPVEEAA